MIFSIDDPIHVDQIARLNHIEIRYYCVPPALEEPGEIDTELPTSEPQAEHLPPTDSADSERIPPWENQNQNPEWPSCKKTAKPLALSPRRCPHGEHREVRFPIHPGQVQLQGQKERARSNA